MRERIRKIIWDFEDIMEQIVDIKTTCTIYAERLRESATEPTTQSMLRTQLKLLEIVENDCQKFDERLDELLRDYLHGRL